jgi:hypothetical protein
MSKRIVLLAASALMAAALYPAAGAADTATAVNGGGTGSLNPSGTPPFSQFGMGIRIFGDGSAAGRFNCLMAGRSAFPGFQLMAVRGAVTAGTGTTTAASFSGAGTLLYNFTGGDGATHKANVTFAVNVSEGGPGVGTLQLTVFGVPFVPGGVAAFPPEWVSSGQIKIH